MTESAAAETIRALATDTDLLAVWQAVHERLCAGIEPARLATVTVADLPAGGIAVLRSWLDTSTRRRRGGSAVSVAGVRTRVPLRELLIHHGLAPERLTEIAELAVGKPLENRARAREVGTAAREKLWAEVASELTAVPLLARRISANGVSESDIGAIALQAHQLGSALTTIKRWCEEGGPPVTLAKLAHDCARDPHAFDLDTLTGRRLAEGIAELLGEPLPARPDLVRALLARAGVLADRLSSAVVVLNVEASGSGAVDQRLRLGGGPMPLTLYDLTVHPPTLRASSLLVVENPSVLEAAMAAGFSGSLACTSGHLRAVDHAFLQRAVDCGVQLSYAGDLDRDGLIIAHQVRDLYGVRIVGMNSEVVRRSGIRPSAVPLGVLPETTSADLATALSEAGAVVFQENDAVLNVLFS
ncbi:TIGR02679 domain-containing protein [Nocardia sp. NPDC056952]|uniref:TIGR02679 domain-containing protein n=1 Tax=Nocardia sp. NPDC056952 TaxID=3345979 RepID=UPI00363A8981